MSPPEEKETSQKDDMIVDNENKETTTEHIEVQETPAPVEDLVLKSEPAKALTDDAAPSEDEFPKNPIIDVTNANFEERFQEIKALLPKTSFISFDLEMTGLEIRFV